MSQYRFRWTCSYMNSAWFEVTGDGQSYEIELRHRVSEYERSIFNGTEEEWQRDIIPLINVIRRSHDSEKGLAQDVVDAFNAWRVAEYLEHRRELDSQPEKYGIIDWDNDAVFRRPVPVRGAKSVYDLVDVPGQSWKGCDWHGWLLNGDNVLAHLRNEEAAA